MFALAELAKELFASKDPSVVQPLAAQYAASDTFLPSANPYTTRGPTIYQLFPPETVNDGPTSYAYLGRFSQRISAVASDQKDEKIFFLHISFYRKIFKV